MELSFGQQLSKDYYEQVISNMIEVSHSAALVGEGSEVIGFDTELSRDHLFGPRCTIFVKKEHVPTVQEKLAEQQPGEFQGFSTTFKNVDGDNQSFVVVTTIEDWLLETFGIEDTTTISVEKWLSIPSQRLHSFSKSEIFHDDDDAFASLQEELEWYPDDVWFWMMAYHWHRIDILEPLLGRNQDLGDFIGFNMISNQLIREIIFLFFLQRKSYYPYEKWLGKALIEADIYEEVAPQLEHIFSQTDMTEKKASLENLLNDIACFHNQLQTTGYISPEYSCYTFGSENIERPYQVMNSASFKEALIDKIESDDLKTLALVGNIDQLTASDDRLINFTDWPAYLEVGYQYFLKK